MEKECLFCKREDPRNRIFAENELFYARWDNFPVSLGHAEIVPKRHVEKTFDLTREELIAKQDLLLKVRDIIGEKHNTDDYTIGENEGELAGRTIPHVHIHVIPRYKGDVENPRGGIRNIIPGKGDYTQSAKSS